MTPYARASWILVALLALAASPLAAQTDGPAVLHVEDVEWTEVFPGVEFGAVTGDWEQGAHGKLVRFAPELASPMHTHTHAYHGIVISGTVQNPFEGEEDPPEMGPGDYWYVPGGAPHVTACASAEPCLFYTHSDHAWDIQVTETEAPAGE